MKWQRCVWEIGRFALLCWIVWRCALCFVTDQAILAWPVAAFLRFYIIPKFQGRTIPYD